MDLVALGRDHAVGFCSGDLNRPYFTIEGVGCQRHLEPPGLELAIPNVGAVVLGIAYLAEDAVRIANCTVVQNKGIIPYAHRNLSAYTITYRGGIGNEAPEEATAADDS